MPRIMRNQSTSSNNPPPPNTDHLHLPLRQSFQLSKDQTRNAEINSPLEFIHGIPLSDLKFGEYIGRGSYGTVRKAVWHTAYRRIDVAVKMFQSEEERESFLIEVRQLSCVRHQNIVRLYGASIENKPAYLVMEYGEGGSLYHLLHNHDKKKQKYDLRHACSWAMQTARGVEYLHSMKPKPIMHRDLKPANLLLFNRGKILKICDFGTACAVRTERATNNIGSACYMAPEVMKKSRYQEKCDVFSWAIIFWEILSRRPPHPNLENVYQVMWKVCDGGRPPLLIDCPVLIEELICKSWDMEPNMRPSMQEVVKKIESIYKLLTPIEDLEKDLKAEQSSSVSLEVDSNQNDGRLASRLPSVSGSHYGHQNDMLHINRESHAHSSLYDITKVDCSFAPGSVTSKSRVSAIGDQRTRALVHKFNLLQSRRNELEKESKKVYSEQHSFYEYQWLKEMTEIKKNELNRSRTHRDEFQ